MKKLSWAIILVWMVALWAGRVQAEDSCNFQAKLYVLTVQTNVVKYGFPELIPNGTNPTIYFKKETNYKRNKNYENRCFDCHAGANVLKDTVQKANVEVKDIFEYLNGSNAPTALERSGTLTHENKRTPVGGGDTEVLKDCSATRSNGVWTSGCAFPDYATTGTLVSYSLTGSAYAISYTNYFEEFHTNATTGEVDGWTKDRQSWGDSIDLSQPYSLSTFLASVSLSDSWPSWAFAADRGTAKKGGVDMIRGDKFTASLSKIKYRIAVMGPKGMESEIKWIHQIKWPAAPGETNSKVLNLRKSAKMKFNGEKQFIEEGGVVVEAPTPGSEVSVILLTPGSCKTCDLNGVGEVKNSSVSARIGLGRMSDGETAGFVYLYKPEPTGDMGTPAVLGDFTHAGVMVLRDGGGIKQIKAPQSLVDVVAITGSKFEARFYSGGVLGTNGWYTPDGQPVAVWTFHDEAGDGTSYKISESRGGVNREYNFAWAGGDSSWTLRHPNGLRIDRHSSSIVGDVRTEVFSVRENDGTEKYREVKRYRIFGDPLGEKLETYILGADEGALTSSWTYYTNTVTDGLRLGKVKEERKPYGDWTRYEYATNGRPTKVVRPFLSAVPGAAENLCHVTEYSYEPVGDGDDGSVEGDSPRMIVEKVLGYEIARKYGVYREGQAVIIECKVPGAEWDAEGNYSVTNLLYTQAGFDGVISRRADANGRVLMEVKPERIPGEATTFTTYAGHGDGGFAPPVKGSKMLTTVGASGFTLLKQAVDLESGEVIESEEYSEVDPIHGPTRVTYLDGTSESRTFGCCGLESVVRRNGSVESFSRDVLGRVTVTTESGVSMIRQLDAAGNLLGMVRQGDDGSTVPVVEMTYDLGGRVLTKKDAAGRMTTYSEGTDANGNRVFTTVQPNGGTTVQVYASDGKILEVGGSATKPKRVYYGVEEDGGIRKLFRKDVLLNTNGTESAEWVKRYIDLNEVVLKTVLANGATSSSEYNEKKQLVKEIDADGGVTLYKYDTLGQLEYEVFDADADGVIDFDGDDRITQTVRDTSKREGVGVRRTRTYIWQQAGVDEKTLIMTKEVSFDGLRTWNIQGSSTNTSVRELVGDGVMEEKETLPGGEMHVIRYQRGKVESEKTLSSDGQQIGSVAYRYDSHGRELEKIDARNGRTVTEYDAADQVISRTTFPRGSSGGEAKTSFVYNDAGSVWKTVQPDGSVVTNEFYLSGELKKVAGSKSVPVEYGYDTAGRVTWMKTWQSHANNAGAALTSWTYDNAGQVTEKRYADNKGPSYTYSPAGRLLTRTWARGTETTYEYNSLGDLVSIDYSDETPDVTFVHDRQGRRVQVQSGGETVDHNFDDEGYPIEDVYQSGPLTGLKVQRSYDHAMRLRTVNVDGIEATFTSFGYDNASRLKSVTNGVYTVEYAYAAQSSLIQDVVFKNGDGFVMHTANTYDSANRLSSTATLTANATKISHAYLHNDLNQRIRTTHADGSYWVYEYDSAGQVKSGKKYWADGTRVAGQSFEYSFDDIGNRKSTKAGGDAAGNGLRSAVYTPNILNQYIAHTVPGGADIIGESEANATVTVNGATVSRKGVYFRKELSLNNTANAVHQGVETKSILSGVTTTNSGSLFLAKTPETYTYDDDGNLLTDGRFEYTWDAENRLIGVRTKAHLNVGPTIIVSYTYDWMGRRRTKNGTHRGGGAYEQAETRFVYDGWNLLAELDGENNLVRRYVWGADLTGTLDGVSGIGGLLMVGDQSTVSNSFTMHFTVYDGLGNLTALMSAANGKETARYEYGPFGEMIRKTGIMAEANPIRFSSKYQDDETGLVYFGYRYLNVETGRWLNRDPLNEEGGINLYCFVENQPTMAVDPDGLTSIGTMLSNFAQKNPKFEGSVELPPIPAGPGRWLITISGSVQFETCCRGDSLFKYLSATFHIRGGYRVGTGPKLNPGPKVADWEKRGPRRSRSEARNNRIAGNARNDWIKDPNDPEQLIKRKKAKDQQAKTKTGYGVSDGDGCASCPETGYVEVDGLVGMEGEFGFKYAIYGKATQELTKDFDPVSGWKLEGGRRDIGWRASSYLEGFIEGAFNLISPELGGKIYIPCAP